MTNYRKLTALLLTIFLIPGCGSLPPIVEGELPVKNNRPRIIKAYDGESRPRENTSMLVGAIFKEQTTVYIIAVDGKATSNKRGLIGGPRAVVVLPGTHDIKIQFHDKGRITTAFDLPGVKLKPGVGYLIDFKAAIPPSIKGNYSQMDSIRIDIMIVNLESKNTIYRRSFNGWGKKV